MMRARSPQGFTLIEVLAGLLLVAIVLPVAMRAIAVGTQASGMARDRLEALSLAQSRLDELVATRDWDRPGQDEPFEPPFDRYRWSFERTAFDGEIEQLTVEVRWDHRSSEQTLSLTTLINTAAAATGE